jgi:hypothetical protein
MANVTIPVTSVRVAEVLTAQNGLGVLAAGDTAIVSNVRDCVVRIQWGSTAGNLTLVGRPGVKSLTWAVAGNATRWIRIADSSTYIQPDDTLHLTVDQAVTQILAITQ